MGSDPPIETACAIGLDVGGTKIAGGLVDAASGRILAKRVMATQPEQGGEAILERSLQMAGELAAEAEAFGEPVLGTGIGVAELVNPAGNVTSSHTIGWQGLPVRHRFVKFGPAVVDSDVRTAALGEAIFGAGSEFSTFVYVTVGTGISSCLVQEMRPHAGARGNALILTRGCPNSADTGQPELLEEVAGGPALVRDYNTRTDGATTRAEEVLSAAEGSDPVAVETVRSAGSSLGCGVGWLVNVLDPGAVVVGGGLGLAGGLYWSSFLAAARCAIWAEGSRDLPIVPAALGNDAGLIGAARLVLERYHPAEVGSRSIPGSLNKRAG